MSDSRTHPPTSRRLQQARREGRVARSRSLTEAIQFVAIVIVLGFIGQDFVRGLAGALAVGLDSIGDVGVRDVKPSDLTPLVVNHVRLLFVLVGPLALAAVGASVIGAIGQSGVVIAGGALRPQWSRLRPGAELERSGLAQRGADGLHMMGALAVFAWIGWSFMAAELARAEAFGRVPPGEAARLAWVDTTRLMWQSALALVALGIVDYAYQRYRFRQSLLMTKQEVKEDQRLTEGHPEVRSRIRRSRSALAKRWSDARHAARGPVDVPAGKPFESAQGNRGRD